MQITTAAVTFDGVGELYHLVERYALAFRPFPVDIVPPDWLHLTVQNVAYIDELDTATIQRIADATAASCEHVAPFEVDIGRAVVHPEAVLLLVIPREPVDHVRKVVRRAIAEVIGSDRPVAGTQVEVRPDGFVPHITLAYSRSNGPAAPLIETVQSIDREPLRVTIDATHLLAVQRAGPAYSCTCVSTSRLRGIPEA